MKTLFLFVCYCNCYAAVFSQDLTKFKLYNPEENAKQRNCNSGRRKPKQEGKHVFIQIGGNWCIWCARFQ